MKQLVIPAIAILLMASCNENKNQESLQILNQKTEMMEQQEKEKIEILLNTYEKALNNSDAKLVQTLYTKDGIFMPTEAPSGIGSEGIFKSYEYVFSQIQLNIKFIIEEIEVEGNMAFAVTSSKGTTLIRTTGDTVPEANRELFVFEKVNGEWKIARYMFNKTEPRS
ncbi:MAG: SgcJ/EcaC family oxidoreductase [Bacteroidetes bacterium]|nr:MAG: SgcJ/EcaC family oxidoreductase [Bacteroidota bacterium]REK07533.1 MAG: SgcJ/EcaC family oxidoreductase [Bacteroidota bacterium]REK37034.1 MAG: SgcJ/EcaC family oxidoreductase [Bacteroidota bacterium]REK47856.1 MAG: SgcJ/EcaC family oxidoreductase [Bacteroidota bacterium]